jgi:hypothetical protein
VATSVWEFDLEKREREHVCDRQAVERFNRARLGGSWSAA